MSKSAEQKVYEFDEFRFDAEHLMLYRRGEPIPLAPKAAETLLTFIEHNGQILSKDKLIELIWPDAFVEESNLFLYLSVLRKTLGARENGKPYLETLRRRGYRFSADVRHVHNSSHRQYGWVLGDLDEEEFPPLLKPNVGPAAKRKRSFKFLTAVLVMVAILAVGYVYVSSRVVPGEVNDPPANSSSKVYWNLTQTEKKAFVEERTKHIHHLIGDDFVHLDDRSFAAVQSQIEWYVNRRSSLSQEPFEEGLRHIFGRASQYAPLVHAEFEVNRVPPIIGIYLAMVESEYRDCLVSDNGPVGLFQFSKRTALKYGLLPEDRCKMDRQARAAARYMSDLLSDFGEPRSSWTLALLSFDQGEEGTRQRLRELRSDGITERTYWTILQNPTKLSYVVDPAIRPFVPRFFAAAIIGETPEAFDLATPPLSGLR